MSDSQVLMKFLQELQRMGITNLENHLSELLDGVKEAQEFLAKLEKIRNMLKEAVKRKDYKELEKLINYLQL